MKYWTKLLPTEIEKNPPPLNMPFRYCLIVLLLFLTVGSLSAQKDNPLKVGAEFSAFFGNQEGLNGSIGVALRKQRHMLYLHAVIGQGIGGKMGYRFHVVPMSRRLVPYGFAEVSFLQLPPSPFVVTHSIQPPNYFSQFMGLGFSLKVAPKMYLWEQIGFGTDIASEVRLNTGIRDNFLLSMGGRYEF